MLSENLSVLATENITEDAILTAYIESILGDSHINWATLLPLTIIYSIFLIVGVFGNLSTCIVIISNEYMRTATNVYLTNLAIADIATLIISKHCFIDRNNVFAWTWVGWRNCQKLLKKEEICPQGLFVGF